MLHHASPLSPLELAAALEAHRFHMSVFILLPWREIYTTDAERDHSFPWVERVHTQLLQWYRSCLAYQLPRVRLLFFECLHMTPPNQR
jgi:predicted ATPase